MNAPFSYLGGKFRLTPTIIGLMPKHTCYVEVFGGSGAVLFAKSPSQVEVYNDIWGLVINFYRVLRSDDWQELQRLCEYTPYSRVEYGEAKARCKQADTGLHAAIDFYSVAIMSFGGRFGAGFGYGMNNNEAFCRQNKISQFRQFHERLKGVLIENLDWQELIEKYDSRDTLFYLDPPYIPDTRKGGGYTHELKQDDHHELVMVLLEIQGKAILSGYTSDIYVPLESAGWIRHEREQTLSVKKNKGGIRETRTECLWVSPQAQRRDMFSGGGGILMQKDWTGNKNTVFTIIGARNYAQDDRQVDDFYATEPSAIDDLFKVEIFSDTIWKPACGQGHLSERMKYYGKQVYSTDLVDRGYPLDDSFNFLSYGDYFHLLSKHNPIPQGMDIITNPPYNKAEEFCKQAIKLTANKVAMFLKLTFLEGQARQKFF